MRRRAIALAAALVAAAATAGLVRELTGHEGGPATVAPPRSRSPVATLPARVARRPSAVLVTVGRVYALELANRRLRWATTPGFKSPHGEDVPVFGDGRRLLLHGYSRSWAVEPKR